MQLSGGGQNIMDPDLYYDGGWDRVEDDHVLSEWVIGRDDERNEDHPGRHRNGRFARDQTADLLASAVQNDSGATGVPVRSRGGRPTPRGTGNRSGTKSADSAVATRLRTNLTKEAKRRGVSKGVLFAERSARYAAGETVETIIGAPERSSAAPVRRSGPPTSLPARSPASMLTPEEETRLRANLNVEAKRRKIPKKTVWEERLRRYSAGASIATIVKQPKTVKPPPRVRKSAAKPAKKATRTRRTISMQGRPIYRSPNRPLPACPSCGAPEVSCRC